MTYSIVKCIAAGFAAAALANGTAAAKDHSSAYLYTGEGIYSKLNYLCDSVDGKKLIAVAKYTKGHASHAMTFDRAAFANGKNHWVKLGEADAGAGQIRYPLIDHETAKSRGHVHTINPGMLGNPVDIAFPALSSITLDGERSKCRFDKDAVFLGVTNDLSHMILQGEDGRYKLLTWSVRDPGGLPEEPDFESATVDDQGTKIYKFAIGHTVITFRVPSDTRKGGASVVYDHDSGTSQKPLIRAYIAAN